MGRRNVGRTDLRDRGRPGDGLTGRRHHGTSIVDDGMVVVLPRGSGGSCSGQMLRLVAASRVGVVVDSRVPCKLVGATETLRTARELAGVRLLAGMRSDMPGLMLQTVKSAVTERALVRSRQILTHLLGGRTSTLHQRGKQAHGRGHIRVCGRRTGGSRRGGGGILLETSSERV